MPTITPRTALALCIALVLTASLPMLAEEDETLRLADGVEMAYVDRGSGEPALVFVHCGNCRKEIWAETLDAFAPSHRVIAMDLPGHGRSGSHEDGVTIGKLGADVAALVEHLELGEVILIGNSLGGPVSLEAARRLGSERALGVVAVDTLNNVERTWPEDAARRVIEAYQSDFRGACRQMMGGLLPEDAPPAIRTRLERETCHNDPDAAMALMKSVPGHDQAASMEAAGVPIRAINSQVYPTEVEINRKHAPSFEVILMEGVGHYPQIEAPKEFQRHLRHVVEELTPDPAPEKLSESPGIWSRIRQSSAATGKFGKTALGALRSRWICARSSEKSLDRRGFVQAVHPSTPVGEDS